MATADLSRAGAILEELIGRERELREYRQAQLRGLGLVANDSTEVEALARMLQAQRDAAEAGLSFELVNTRYETIGGDPLTILYLGETNTCRFTVEAAGSSLQGAVIRMDWKAILGSATNEEALKYTPPTGWTAKFVKQGQSRYWELTNPDGNASSAVFVIENIKLQADAKPEIRGLEVSWKISGNKFKNQTINVQLALLSEGLTSMTAIAASCCAPPDASAWNVLQNNHQLTVDYKQPDEVFINPGSPLTISNRLWFYLSNTSTTEVIANKQTMFQISFRTGEGHQALDKSDSTAKLEIVGSGPNWTISESTDAGLKVWTLRRQGNSLFEAGEVVTLQFSGLSPDEGGMTAIDVAYFNFPDHANGSMPIRVHKRYPEAAILEVTCPPPIAAETTTEKADIQWKVFGGVPSLRSYPDGWALSNLPAVGKHSWDIGSNGSVRFLSLRLTDGAPAQERILAERILTTAQYVGPCGFGANLGFYVRYLFLDPPRPDYHNFWVTITASKMVFRGDYFDLDDENYYRSRKFEATYPISIRKMPRRFQYYDGPTLEECESDYQVISNDGKLTGRYFITRSGALNMTPQKELNNMFWGGGEIVGDHKVWKPNNWVVGGGEWVTVRRETITLPQICFYEVSVQVTNSTEGGYLSAKECGL